MFEGIDGDDKILFLENINSSGPSFDVFVVLGNFDLHPLVEQFQVFLAVIGVLFEELSSKLLDEKG